MRGRGKEVGGGLGGRGRKGDEGGEGANERANNAGKQ